MKNNNELKVNVGEKKFTDQNGTQKVTYESDEMPLGGNFNENSYKLANDPLSKPKTKTLKKHNNIGIGSNGFAAVVTLATLIVIASIVVSYITLKY